MDLFYPNWSSATGNKDTVCIPACLDMEKGNHIGPEGINSKEYKEQKGKVQGKNAEKKVLHAFQRLTGQGGIVLAALQMNKQMTSDRRKTKNIIEAVRKTPSFREYLEQLKTNFEVDEVK